MGGGKCLKDSTAPYPRFCEHPSPQLDEFELVVEYLHNFSFSAMSTSSTQDRPYTMEPGVTAPKKTIWQSIRENPKVIFIAFFAS